MIRCTVYGNGGGKDPPSDEALCNAEKKEKQCITKKESRLSESMVKKET